MPMRRNIPRQLPV